MGVSRGATNRAASCCGKMLSRLLLMVAVVLALAGADPGTARADWDDRPDAGEFEESLSPHGYWVDDSQFGRVWRPNVWWTWQPYVDGRWIWTSYGWTWASDEPWGWTFHYGRWGFSNLHGWVWTPGYVWGPAWVDWYWGDGYVGWAPLGPAGFTVVPTYWTYVHDFSFCSPHVTNVVILHDHVPPYIVHHREQGWGARHAPDYRDIEHVSRYRIDRVADRPDDSVAPWIKHRIERGQPLRERVADGGGERVIEHPGRNASVGHGRPQPADDGWRRPNERDRIDQAAPPVVDRGRGDAGNGPVMHGRTENDDHMRPPQDQNARPPIQHGSDDAFHRPGVTSDDGRGWAHQPPLQPQHSHPFPAPTDRPPSMGYHGAGRVPTFVERGQPGPMVGGAPPRGDGGPRGDAGAHGNPAAAGSGTQHGHGGWSGPGSSGHSAQGGAASGAPAGGSDFTH